MGPCDSVEVVKVARPVESRAPVPSVVFLSRNVTGPDGMPEPGAVTETVAVNVTGRPTVDGSEEEASTVVVPSLLTT